MSDAVLDHTSPVPLFLQIRQCLLGEIRYWTDPLERFPTDQELAARFGVSKMTIRKALDDLVDAGLLIRRRGAGTFVTDRAFVEQLTPSLDRARSDLAEEGAPSAVRVLGFQRRPASPSEVEVLSCRSVVTLQRVRAVRGVPLALDERTVCADLADRAGLTEETARENIALRLRRAIALRRAQWRLRATLADREIATHLCLTRDVPVMERAMRYLTEDGRTVLIGRTVHRGDLVDCTVELPLDPTEES